MADQEAPKKLGRYEIVRELAKGAMGIVYEGRDPNIGRRVAIKTARHDVLEASGRLDEMLERFLREAQAAGGLNHPNIITIYDAGEEQGMAYIAMEYLEGGDLEDYIAKNRHIDQEKAVEICAATCAGLAVAHRQGVVHRDVKPANIMLVEGGGIKVADFGIAHVSDSNLTQEGAMIGTPHYMSPEQFQGRKVDGRSDLFAVGVILYEMMTSQKPFTGDVLSTVMTAVMKSTPIEPRELNITMSETLSNVIMKAISKDPSQRYQTGDEFAAALIESIKPNPDPAITKVAPTATDATVLASPGGDDTLITEEAMQIAAPAAEAAQAGASEQTAEEPSPPRAAAPELAPAAGKKKNPLLLVGVVVLAAAGLGVAYTLFGGGPFYERVMVEAWLCPDQDAYNEWQQDTLTIPNTFLPAAGATVEVVDTVTGLPVAKRDLSAEGKGTLKLDAKLDSFLIRISLADHKADSAAPWAATEKNEVLDWGDRVLLHRDVDESAVTLN